MTRRAGRVRSGASRGDPLTGREAEVLALVAAGESTRTISEQLQIAEATTKAHMTRIYQKIGARNRVQAAQYHQRTHGQGAAVAGRSLIERQIAEIEARLSELAPIEQELIRLREALEALRTIADR